ncbi:MAG TPA: DUF2269 domain-containing protein [Candidatus Thermoplasmatota archaeon]|nr:DUF2269 domain-containing protein [Candidatus Thermoplasmatota archaeon]
MRASPTLRKGVLALHIMASVGWLGAVAGFIVLDVATVASPDAPILRAAYIGMDLLADWAIVPLAVAALATGIAISLLTPWGLFRHWWVAISLALTVAATLVLLAQMPVITHRADVARDPATTDAALGHMGNLLLHSVGGTLVLVVVTVLNVAKPRGLTRHGWRRLQAEAAAGDP